MVGVVWKDLCGLRKRKDGQLLESLHLYDGRLGSGEVLLVIGYNQGETLEVLEGLAPARRSGLVLQETGQVIEPRRVVAIRSYADPLLSQMTANETVRFCPSFRIADKDLLGMHTQIILEQFGLAKDSDRRTGPDPMYPDLRYRSIQIAKKLALLPKLALVSDPFQMFQPTDAITLLKRLKGFSGQTGIPMVVSLTELPRNSDLIQIADKILMVSLDGHVVYLGPPQDAVEYFGQHEVRPMSHMRLGAFLHSVVSIDLSGPIRFRESTERVQRLVVAWRDNHPISEITLIVTRKTAETYEVSKWTQFRLLTWRFKVILFRDWQSLIVVFIQATCSFLLTSFVFMNIAPVPSQLGIPLRLSLFFVIAVNSTFSVTVPACLFYRSHRYLVDWEAKRMGLYAPWLTPLAKLLNVIPFRMVLTAAFVVPLYYIVGLRQDSFAYMLVFLAILMLNTMTSAIIGVFAGSITPNLESAQLLSVMILDVYILFAGLGSPTRQVSWIIKWLQFLSPIYYTFRGILRNELTSVPDVDWKTVLTETNNYSISVAWCAGGLLILTALYLSLCLIASSCR